MSIKNLRDMCYDIEEYTYRFGNGIPQGLMVSTKGTAKYSAKDNGDIYGSHLYAEVTGALADAVIITFPSVNFGIVKRIELTLENVTITGHTQSIIKLENTGSFANANLFTYSQSVDAYKFSVSTQVSSEADRVTSIVSGVSEQVTFQNVDINYTLDIENGFIEGALEYSFVGHSENMPPSNKVYPLQLVLYKNGPESPTFKIGAIKIKIYK